MEADMLITVLRNQIEIMDWMRTQSYDAHNTRGHRGPLMDRIQKTNLVLNKHKLAAPIREDG